MTNTTGESVPVDVSELLEALGESVEVRGELALSSLDVGPESFALRRPAAYDVTLSNVGSAIVALGSISAPVRATCSRCLCEFDTVIEAEVDGFYVRPGDEEGVPEEQEIEPIEADSTVDIGPALVSALVLEAPFAPLHAEDCAGICPTCGADLNEGPCDCAPTSGADHPFAGLKSLLGEEDAGAQEPTD
jgi:uncharacterized protein